MFSWNDQPKRQLFAPSFGVSQKAGKGQSKGAFWPIQGSKRTQGEEDAVKEEIGNSSQYNSNRGEEIPGLFKNDSIETIEQSHSTKQESLLLTFSGNAFSSQEFDCALNQENL